MLLNLVAKSSTILVMYQTVYWLIDWLIIFIKSFLTQPDKIQHMIKYTITVLVTKQQLNKQKTHAEYC